MYTARPYGLMCLWCLRGIKCNDFCIVSGMLKKYMSLIFFVLRIGDEINGTLSLGTGLCQHTTPVQLQSAMFIKHYIYQSVALFKILHSVFCGDSN